ncbi:MAG TPA: sn-glycerol-3-phosphate ABC transporter ATP-binding protein UgpC [Calditrichia bacterium]|nr:sn-glycerol-3-phosphate ABC transporter ATP-binding protein UgpC [Calditrichota bacterium]HQV32483.1 sn-glycerol-3-phosphate ABC transporter ATP-binding protein UgpC [Calditrichia bacterium]
MARVELQNVSKIYDNKVTAISDANLTFEDQEFVVLVGPSGCGKSTLLRMIAGLEEISGGTLSIDGRVVNDVPPKDRDIAMVFQNYALYPHMSVYDNMAFGLKLRKFDKEDIRKRVHEAAEILGISDYLDRKPKAMSGGQRQRVALGRAIVRKPKVFLFDEPLSNLDAKLRVQMRIEISRLHSRLKSTMIYVTHDQIEAMTMGSKIVVLKDGFIQQVDSPLNLYNNPANMFVAGFIGSPSMNFIPGELSDGNGMIFQAGDLNIPVPAAAAAKLTSAGKRSVVLGIRPENLHDSRFAASPDVTEGIPVRLEVVEPIGNEVFLYFNAGNQNICMRTAAEHEYQVQDSISLGLDQNRLFFFDPDTQERLV